MLYQRLCVAANTAEIGLPTLDNILAQLVAARMALFPAPRAWRSCLRLRLGRNTGAGWHQVITAKFYSSRRQPSFPLTG